MCISHCSKKVAQNKVQTSRREEEAVRAVCCRGRALLGTIMHCWEPAEHCWEPSEQCWEPSEQCWESLCPHRPIPGHMSTESQQHFLCASMLAGTAVLSRWFKNESVNLWAGSCVQESQRWPAPKDHLSLYGLFTALSDPSKPLAAVQRWMLCQTPARTNRRQSRTAGSKPAISDRCGPMCCQCPGTFILAKTIQS